MNLPVVEVFWSDEALKHLARSQRYPGALDIEVGWTVEVINDADAVQVDPYWTSRSTHWRSSANRPRQERCSSCPPTATATVICTA